MHLLFTQIPISQQQEWDSDLASLFAVVQNQYSELETELAEVQAALHKSETELAAAQAALRKSETELGQATTEKNALEEAIRGLQMDVAAAKVRKPDSFRLI